MYLRAWNSQQSIADILGVPQQTVSDIISSTEKRQVSNFGKDFQPLLYNIWKKQKGEPCVLTQAEIGEVIGVSRKQVADYNQIINKIVPSFMELAKEHQIGRGTSNVPNGTFNFTEGWFRTSGLYHHWQAV